jgi:hypothetical protein
MYYTSTCTNNLCQHVLYINLYHKQMHQPCTKPVQITCHNNLSKQPVINLYHKQVHQPFTNLYLNPVPSTSASTMHQICTNHASNTHKLRLIKMSEHHQLYTSCMCQLINYLSQPCTQHVPQPKALINFIIQI